MGRAMRKLISAFKISIDGKMEGAEGFADWVDSWSEDYDLSSQIDACVLGGRMYGGYEQYWSAVQNNQPDKPLPMTGKVPTAAEFEWARFAAQTPHYVLSKTLTSAVWPGTRFLRGIDEIAALKRQPGKDIYVMGGAQIAASLMDAGLMDEIRLIIYPLIVGEGKALFGMTQGRHGLDLQKTQQLSDGRVSLVYRVT